jgi:hypothetical protein
MLDERRTDAVRAGARNPENQKKTAPEGAA